MGAELIFHLVPANDNSLRDALDRTKEDVAALFGEDSSYLVRDA